MKISKEKNDAPIYIYLQHFTKNKIKILEDENGNTYAFWRSKNLLVKIKEDSEIDELILNLQLNKNNEEMPQVSIKQGQDIRADFYSEDIDNKYNLLFEQKDSEFSDKISKIYGSYIKPPLRVALNSLKFLNEKTVTKETAKEYLELAMNKTKMLQQRRGRPISEYSFPGENVEEEILDEFASLIEQMQNPILKFQICELKDLEYDEKKHLSSADVTKKLIDNNTKFDEISSKQLLDISGLPEEVQIILMKNLYEKEIEVTQEEKMAIRDYQSLEYNAFKALMNNSKEKYLEDYLQKLMSGNIKRMTIDRTVKDIYTLIDTFDKFSNRKRDLLISRVGTETISDNSTVELNSFSSFATNLGTNTMENKDAKIFKTILDKESPSIPITFLAERKDWATYKECEVLLPPASYTAKECDGNIRLERQAVKTKDIPTTIRSQLSIMELKVQEMIAKRGESNDKLDEILKTIKISREFMESREGPIKRMDENSLKIKDENDKSILSKNEIISIAKETTVVLENGNASKDFSILEKEKQINRGNEQIR